MSTIVTRAGKGSPLTHTEVDSNFTNLNTDKAESTNPTLSGNVSTTGLNFDSNTFVIDATNNRVGVGTASPSEKLEIAGTTTTLALKIVSTTAANYTWYTNTGGSLYVGIDNSAGSAFGSAYSRNIYSDGAYPLLFWTNGTERMRIDSSGNVGIGQSSPTNALDITRPNGTATQIRLLQSSLESWQIGMPAGVASLTFANSGTEQMRITTSGNVGIGTSSPSYKLDVLKNINGSNLINIDNQWGTSGANSGVLLTTADVAGSSTSTFSLQKYKNGAVSIANNETNSAAYLGFTVGSSERMRLDSSGNLGLGVTPVNAYANTKSFEIGQRGVLWATTTSSNMALATNAYLNSSAAWTYKQTGIPTAYQQYEGSHIFYTAPSGTAGNAITFTQAMTLDANGNLGLGATSISSVGAYRIMEINGTTGGILYMQTAGTRVLQLYGSSGESGLWMMANNPLTFATNNTERMRIDSSGMLGLGITPSQTSGIAMEFGGSANNNAINFLNSGNAQGWITSNAYYNGTNWLRKYASGTTCTAYATNVAGTHAWYVAPASTAGSTISWTQAMTLDTSGNLLVGATAQVSTEKAYIYQSGTGRVLIARSDNASFAGNCIQASVNRNTTNGTFNAFAYYNDAAAAYRFIVYDSGSILSVGSYNNTTGSGANLFIASDGNISRSTSSLKYKRDVVDAKFGLDDLLKLRAVNYKSKTEADGETVYGGLIAEEVHEAGLTEFVQYANDGSPDALAYGNMVSLCVKAIQELKAELDSLKAQLNK